MNKKEFEKRWLEVFAKDVSKIDLKMRVLGRGNYLWHIFSWELVSCKIGDEARKAFDELDRKKGFLIQMWLDEETKVISGDFKSSDFDDMQETFIVDTKFKWNYVVTHESTWGPYFYYIT
jgi:tRNA (guanine-N7-)-methyltransferase